MSEINRGLIIVKPKQPLLDWLRKLNPNQEGFEDLEAIQFDNTAYLVPEFGDDEEQQQILNDLYPFIFDSELEAWEQEEDVWPKKRDLKMFLEWFDVEFHSVVDDLAEGLPMRDEDDEYLDDRDDFEDDD